jgi:hypothetical protein
VEETSRVAGPLADRPRDGLLDIPEGQRTSPLEQLKKGTGHRQRPGIYRSAGAVYPAAKPGIFPTEFYRSAIQLRNLARYAGMASVKYIARMPQQRKLAVLTAFVKAQETAALDEPLMCSIC